MLSCHCHGDGHDCSVSFSASVTILITTTITIPIITSIIPIPITITVILLVLILPRIPQEFDHSKDTRSPKLFKRPENGNLSHRPHGGLHRCLSGRSIDQGPG